jgi:hypothetical protein
VSKYPEFYADFRSEETLQKNYTKKDDLEKLFSKKAPNKTIFWV